jgi:CubicO group peptidase (beta-lactamase class C family)
LALGFKLFALPATDKKTSNTVKPRLAIFVYLCAMRFIFLVALVAVACSNSTDPKPALASGYFPPLTGTGWESTTPTSLGWNEAAVPALYDFLRANNTRAFLVLKDGKIVIEQYFGKQLNNSPLDFTVTSNWYWASAGKTLTSALVGIANAQGKINFDAKTSDYLGVGWTSLTLAQENAITVRHQLTMTTGLDDAVANPDCTTKACLVFKTAPGTRWAYHNAPYTLLDGVVASATGKSLNTFVTEEIKTKIGMDGQFIKTGDNNVYYSTARGMARFGLLLLNRGKWADQVVIPESYVDLLMTTSQNLNVSYGYLTWLNGKSNFMVPGVQTVFPGAISPNAPAELFAAMGKNGQFINVVPNEELVVIRMGDAPDNSLVPFTFQDTMWRELNKVIR